MTDNNQSWQQKTIGDFVSIKRGYDLTSKQRQAGNVPVYGAAGQNGFHNEVKTKAPGIVIGRSGGSFGKVHYVNEDFWPHNTAMYVTDFKGNDPAFAYYLLKLLDFSALNSGSAQPSLNRNYLYPVKINVPDPKLQKVISGILSDLDKKIETNNKINLELESMAKLVYDYWFIQFDFPDVDGQPYKASGGRMIYSDDIGREIPENWSVKKVKDIASTASGGTPLKSKKEYYDGGSIPWINSGEVNKPFIIEAKRFITELGVEKSSAKLFPSGTILMAMYGATAGKVSFTNFAATTNQAICAINPDKEHYNFYLKFGLERLYQYLVNLSSGSARDNLSQDKIKELMFPIPESQLLESYHKKVAPMMDKVLSNLEENRRLIQLRDWLLPMLMNGQVTVNS